MASFFSIVLLCFTLRPSDVETCSDNMYDYITCGGMTNSVFFQEVRNHPTVTDETMYDFKCWRLEYGGKNDVTIFLNATTDGDPVLMISHTAADFVQPSTFGRLHSSTNNGFTATENKWLDLGLSPRLLRKKSSDD